MTTLAWDGKALAADKRVSCGSGRIGQTTKIARRKEDGALIGACGATAAGQALVKWFLAGEEGDLPKLEFDKENSTAGFIIRPDGEIDDITTTGIAHITSKLYVRGSGADYALGAMSMGANSRQAVEIASQWDNNTGDGVDVLYLNKEEKLLNG